MRGTLQNPDVLGGGGGAVQLDAQFATVGNTGFGPDDLMTYSVPAGTLAANGARLELEASGRWVASANSKGLMVVLGGTTLYDSGVVAIGAALYWRMKVQIMRTAAGAQRWHVLLTLGDQFAAAGYQVNQYGTSAENEAAALTLKMQARCSAAVANQVECFTQSIDYIPAP